MAPTILQLLKEPFGPFWDRDVLSDKCKSRSPLELSDVMMACGNRPIGLTLCEKWSPECQEQRLETEGPVLVRGVLDIEKLDWLTEYGRRTIQEKLDQRITQYFLKDGVRINKMSLEALYNVQAGPRWRSGRTVKIQIQGEKELPALYLRSRLLPDGLLIQLQERQRAFNVISMDIETYKLSRLYLARFRLLRDMEDILKHVKETTGQEVPPESRTPEWYVEKYLELGVSTDFIREHRLIHDSEDDSDIEPNSYGKLKEGRVRKLRYVSHAEVRSLFAMHALWLVQDQARTLHKNNRAIHIDNWKTWLQDVPKWRHRAARENPDMSFGVFDRSSSSAPLTSAFIDDRESDGDADFAQGQMPALRTRKRKREGSDTRGSSSRASSSRLSADNIDEVTRVRKSISRISLEPSRQKKHTRQNRDARTAIYSQVHSSEDDGQNSYDSDLSTEDSTPNWTDSDDSFGSPSRLPSPTLLSRIPRGVAWQPTLSSSCIWWCPVEHCLHRINMLKLREGDTACLEPACAQAIARRGWKISDEWVQVAFNKMVDVHLHWHLDQEGIEFYADSKGRSNLRWKVPQAHPTGRSRGSTTRTAEAAIKEEE